MKKVKFTNLAIQNFCHIKEKTATLGDWVSVHGKNGSGKTTVQNAILWLLTDKLIDGSSAGDQIRPHDDEGKPIDFIDIMVCLNVNVDGEEFELCKTQKQKWVTKRGSDDRKFEGNENSYTISGIPKSAKEYDKFINDNICPIDRIGYFLNANIFLAMDTKKRREVLFNLISEVSDKDIIDMHPEFEELSTELKVGTYEEISKKFTKAISESKKKLQTLPARIDEVTLSIAQIDEAELNIAKQTKTKELADIVVEISEAQSADSNLEKEILKMENEVETIKNQAFKDITNRKNELNDEIRELSNRLFEVKRDIMGCELNINDLQKSLSGSKYIPTEEDIAKAESAEFSGDVICPMCGQEYPAEKVEEIKAKFEAEKQRKVAELKDQRKTFLKMEEDDKKNLEAENAKHEALEKTKAELNSQVKSLELQRDALNVDALLDANEGYNTLKAELRAKQLKSEESTNVDTLFALTAKKIEIEKELKHIEEVFTIAGENAKKELRIEQLKAEQRDLAQLIMDQERKRDLLEAFNKTKVNLVTNKINEHFKMVDWVLFQPQINGGYRDVCWATVKGSSVEGLLNNSDKILAKADICCGFQNAHGYQMPIFIDDMESINNDRVANFRQSNTDRQVFAIEVTENSELVIG